jgi:hypothetical protein
VSTILSFIVMAAAEEAGHEETSKTLYYVAGGALTALALIVSAIGIMRHEKWPASTGARNAVMGVVTLVVVATMASAVITG